MTMDHVILLVVPGTVVRYDVILSRHMYTVLYSTVLYTVQYVYYTHSTKLAAVQYSKSHCVPNLMSSSQCTVLYVRTVQMSVDVRHVVGLVSLSGTYKQSGTV